MDGMDVGVVKITTEEYLADKMRIFNLEEEIKKSEQNFKVACNCYTNAAEAIKAYIRKNSKYGEYPYLSNEQKELLASIGESWQTFDLTIRPDDEEGSEE